MARGMGNKASTAEGKEKSLQGEETPSESRKEAHFEMEEETSSGSEWDMDSDSDLEIVEEEEDDDDDDENEEEVVTHVLAPAEGSPSAVLGNYGLLSVLCETPSGFAIFSYHGSKIVKPDGCQKIWADFVGKIKANVWLKGFQTFEDKASAINSSTGVSEALAAMIRKHMVLRGQTLAVGNQDYRRIIEKDLGIPCLYGPAVEELMWGLKFQMRKLVPAENPELINEDRLPMSAGMQCFLNLHRLEVKPDMMVTKRIIEMAGVIYECDFRVNKYKDNYILCGAAEHIKKISHIDTGGWDLMKLATAVKMICYPEEKIEAATRLFRIQQLKRFSDDAPKYKRKIMKVPCLEIYNEMYNARKMRLDAAKVLLDLLKRAEKAYEAENAFEAARDHKIGPLATSP
nr:uncharacterized protein LOC127333727 [Lolium perenne]